MRARGNYGVDSPPIVAALLALGVAGLSGGVLLSSAWRWPAYVFGAYFLLGCGGMLYYSKVGKLALRERLLDKIPWRGNEVVLDVGCGRGLLAVGAAHRVPSGRVVGMDVWNPRAITGNRAQAVLDNAKREGVDGRVEAKEGDARALPFGDGTFDVVVSNFVVHEMNTRPERQQMMREIARVLKAGGRVGLVDFIFTDECVEDLKGAGVEAGRVRDAGISFWISAILNFGIVRTYYVVGKKV